MKTIIVQNKIDLEKSSQTQESEIIELINNKKKYGNNKNIYKR